MDCLGNIVKYLPLTVSRYFGILFLTVLFLSNEKNRLEMAGGEFCVNATRCAVYEYLKGEKGELEISVSGAEKMLKGKVIDNDKVEVTMKIEKD